MHITCSVFPSSLANSVWPCSAPPPVEGALSKDMATLGEYLLTWKLKLSTTKTVSAIFHLNSKEAKRELKVTSTTKPYPFAPRPNTLE